MRLEPISPKIYRVVIGEQNSFSVYGVSGGLVGSRVAYLVQPGVGEMPDSLKKGDLGLPSHSEPLRIFKHERGWKHAAFWTHYYVSPGRDSDIANNDEEAAERALLDA